MVPPQKKKKKWQWKIHHLKMYFLLKMVIFQCHGCKLKAWSFQKVTIFSGNLSHENWFSGRTMPLVPDAGAVVKPWRKLARCLHDKIHFTSIGDDFYTRCVYNIYIYIWSNYNDLTRPHPKWWFRKGTPLISGKSRSVKYYNLARYIYIYIYTSFLATSDHPQKKKQP